MLRRISVGISPPSPTKRMLRILLLSLVVVLCTAAAEVTEIHVCNAGWLVYQSSCLSFDSDRIFSLCLYVFFFWCLRRAEIPGNLL